jgi:hypothetical protein
VSGNLDYLTSVTATDTTKQQAALSFDRRESVCSVTSDTDNNVEMQVAINLDKSVNNILTNQDFFPSGHKLRESASLVALFAEKYNLLSLPELVRNNWLESHINIDSWEFTRRILMLSSSMSQVKVLFLKYVL